ncbi:MAG: carboxypeptidase-like regulatory domain-containing protein [Planctomycetota bacterium]
MHAKALVVLLLLFVVACVAGWFAFKAGGGDVEPGALSPKGERAASAVGQPATAQSEVDRPTSSVSAAGALDRKAVPAPDVGKVPDGSVVVRGRLVDGKSVPRAGVAVQLTTWSTPDGFDGSDFDFAGPGQRNAPAQPRATTSSDGTFQLALAVDRGGALSLPDDDLVFAEDPPRVRGKKGDQDLSDVVVVRAGALQGIVRDQNGQPVADVKVSATVGAFAFGTSSSAMTAADGTFSVGKLRPGKWTLRTASGKFLPTVEEHTLAPEQRLTDLVVVVRPGQAIAGQVVDERGQPVANFKVGSKRKEVRGAVDIERFASDEAAVTDQYGFFTLSGLAEPVVTLKAFGPGHTTATVADVSVGTGNLLVRVERLAVIEGILVAGDGSPIEGSRITAEGSSANGTDHRFDVADLQLRDGNASATTDVDGRFRVESVTPGAVTVTARGKGHRSVEQAVAAVQPGQTLQGVRLVADRGAVARVKVVDENGVAVAGAWVRVERVNDEATPGAMRVASRAVSLEDGAVTIGNAPETLGAAETDAEGTAVIPGLPAGNATVRATHAKFAAALPARLMLPASGAVEASLTLREPGFAEITVLLANGTTSAQDALRVVGPADGNREGTRSKTDEAGVARLGPFAPGVYTVRLTRAPAATHLGDAMVFMVDGDGGDIASSVREFVVVAGKTTRVELRRPVLTKIHGVVSGVDGPVVGCTVELVQRGEDSFDLPGFGNRGVKTAADGSFAHEDVESGSYVLRYGKPDQIVKANLPIDVPPNLPEMRQDLVLRTGKLRVQVCTAGTSEAIVGAEVEVVPSAAADTAKPPRQEHRVMMMTMSMSTDANAGGETTTMTMGAPRARTDEDGWAEIDDVPVGEYTLKVRHKKHAPATKAGQVVHETQTTECGRVELATAGQIRGKVLTADGKAADMALVDAQLLGTHAWSEPEMAMGGSFRLTGLPAGKHSVRARQVGAGAPVYGPVIEVEVNGGETSTAELRLPRN